MTKFLIRLFVKNSENTNNPKVREAYGKLSGTVGIVANILIAISKFIVGIIYGWSSVIADAANNMTDSLASVVTLVGFRLSGKPADKEHPYGHERIEYISALLVSFIIIFIGVELTKSSIAEILAPTPSYIGTPLFVVLVSTSVVKLWIFFFNRYISGKIASQAIYATGRESLNDTIATGTVLLSAILSSFIEFSLDGYVGLAVALYIIYTGITLVRDTINPLLGTLPSAEVVDKITSIIGSAEGIIGYHDLIVHTYGPNKYFSSVHIEVDAGSDLLVTHEISDNIERDVRRQTGIDLVVHIDPLVRDDERIANAIAMVSDILLNIDSRLSFHDFRMVERVSHTNLLFDICAPYDMNLSDDELVREVIAEIHSVSREFECIITVDRTAD